MKTYKAILLAVVGLVIVVTGGYIYMKKHTTTPKEAITKSTMKSLEGQVTRMFEGENKVVYDFEVPEDATSTVSMDGALVKVTTGGALYMATYFSYEGGRGYSAEDYIRNTVAPHVNVLTITGTTTIGSRVWTVAESANTEWHVGQVGDGQWLMVVESPKANHEDIVGTLAGLKAE
ncbi:MAG: hypothetical protein ACAH17_02440 [Candidatus Paceibacterota bacterium]